MSNPKTFQRYEASWWGLLDKWKENPQEVVSISCESPKHAKGMRLEFYKMREAALRDPHMAQEYAEALNSREVKVVGNDIVFSHKDNSWIGKLISKYLEKDDEAGKA